MSQAADSRPVTNNTPSSSSHHGTSEAEEHYHRRSSKELHWCIFSAITVLAGFIQLRYGAGAGAGAAVSLFSMEHDTAVAFLVVFMVYLGSLAVKILQARKNPDLSEFMDKISLSSGTLAITLELLILVPALGWFAIAAWSICLVIAVTKSYSKIADVLIRLYQEALQQLLQVFNKLKEFMNIGASAGVVASGMFDKSKEQEGAGAGASAGEMKSAAV